MTQSVVSCGAVYCFVQSGRLKLLSLWIKSLSVNIQMEVACVAGFTREGEKGKSGARASSRAARGEGVKMKLLSGTFLWFCFTVFNIFQNEI